MHTGYIVVREDDVGTLYLRFHDNGALGWTRDVNKAEMMSLDHAIKWASIITNDTTYGVAKVKRLNITIEEIKV